MRATRNLFGAASLLAATLLGLAAGGPHALAVPPQSGDVRAVAYEGNVDIGHAGDACDVVGLPGDEAVLPPGAYTSDGVLLDITSNPTGLVITGVVVKGGLGYNVYPVANLGALPWLDLRSPIDSAGKPAGVSHWFVCADVAAETTTTAPTTTTQAGAASSSVPATTTAVAATATATATTTPGSVSNAAATTITTTTTAVAAAAAVAGSGSADELARTGSSHGWLLVAGLALVAAGAAFLASPKLRRRPRG